MVPWVRRSARGIRAVAGPDALTLTTDVPLRGEGLTTVSDFAVAAGDRRSLALAWHPSHLPAPAPVEPDDAVAETEAWWRRWAERCTYEGPNREAVLRSLITGLLAEQYDPRARRLLGNFPQALSHIALINSACNLSQAGRPARHRAGG